MAADWEKIHSGDLESRELQEQYFRATVEMLMEGLYKKDGRYIARDSMTDFCVEGATPQEVMEEFSKNVTVYHRQQEQERGQSSPHPMA